MEQTRFNFEWEMSDGTLSTVDPNLYSSIVLSAGVYTASQSSSWSVNVPNSAHWKISSIDTSLADRLEAIEKRLAILNLDADPTHQMLDTLYKKYKMVEALAKKDGNNEE